MRFIDRGLCGRLPGKCTLIMEMIDTFFNEQERDKGRVRILNEEKGKRGTRNEAPGPVVRHIYIALRDPSRD